jgi:hypothetical protein
MCTLLACIDRWVQYKNGVTFGAYTKLITCLLAVYNHCSDDLAMYEQCVSLLAVAVEHVSTRSYVVTVRDD